MANFCQKSWETFRKTVFLAIFAKFGTITIWQEAILPLSADARCETWSRFLSAIGLYFERIT